VGLPTITRLLRDLWIESVLRYHKAVLALGLLATVVAVLFASKLTLDSDLRTLMPEGNAIVQSLEELEDGFGTLGSVDLIVKLGTADARHDFADAVALELADHPLVRDVDQAPEASFFLDHALYYLSDDDIEELAERVMAVEHFELCSRAPDLCVGDPDPKAGDKLREFVDTKREKAQDSAGFESYYERDGIDALVVFIFPSQPSADLKFCQRVTEALREAIKAVHERPGSWSDTDLEYNLVGPYVAKGEEQRHVPRDMVRSGLIGVFGVIAVLFVLYRSWKAVMVLLLPLLAGVAWSMGLTQIMLSHLNTMTSLISSVILGMGIDAGIHLLSRVRAERDKHDDIDAIRHAFRALFGPLLVASSTTIGAFSVMIGSDFPVFREFGIIGACGVAFCLLAMLTLFPALLALTGVPKRSARLRKRGRRSKLIFSTFIRRAPMVLLAVVAVSVLCWPGFLELRENGFERDTRTLKSDHVRELVDADGELAAKIFGKHTHPSAYLVDDYETLERTFNDAVAAHQLRLASGPSSVVGLFSAVQLMPPSSLNMQNRHERIQEITEDFSDKTWNRLEGKGGNDASAHAMSSEEAKRLRRMLKAKPFTVEDLPDKILDRLRTKDGRWAILAYPNFYGDILQGVNLIEESRAYNADSAPYVGEETVFAAMYNVMRDEWPVILGMASLVVLAIVFVQLRSAAKTLMTLLPLLVGIWWMLGAMGTFGIHFNLFNFPVFPAILGIGVDHGVYLTSAIGAAEGRSQALVEEIDDTARAILGASATTAIGFGSFMVADSGGLRGIGTVAVLGICVSAISALTVLPAIAGLRLRRANRT